jgi:polar amino acid transport system substrate-binding protein
MKVNWNSLRINRRFSWMIGTMAIWIMLPITPVAAFPFHFTTVPISISSSISFVGSAAPRVIYHSIDNSISNRSNSGSSNSSSRLVSQREATSKMPPDIQRILQRGKLIVATLNQDNPPFFVTNSAGELEGLDAEVARSLADQLGVEVEFNRSAATFDQVVKSVYQLDADLAISKLSRTLNRAKLVRFTQPYVTMRQGLLVNRLQIAQQANGRNIAEVIRGLEGKVGVIQGSSYVGFLQKKFPKAEIVEFPSWSAAIDAVIRGEVLATYRDELEVKKIVLSKPDAALQFQTIALTDTEDSIAIALPWDSQHLLAFVNQSLEMMHINHTADSLLQDYPKAGGKK